MINVLDGINPRIVVFPNPHYITINPYLNDLSRSVNAINKNETKDKSIINFYKHLFDGDIYIFNWPENIIYQKYGFIQYILFLIGFFILKLRKIKVILIFHNITPHLGHNFFTKFIIKIFFKFSNLIITHSLKGLKYLNKNSKIKSIYIPHPFQGNCYNQKINSFTYDIIIWGSIFRYKGILEFLKNVNKLKRPEKILIIGKCEDKEYDLQIKNNINCHVIYENKFVEKDILNDLILKSKYVVFPYLMKSVSSSGALIDSLLLGKTVIGPNTGAFQDLSKEGLCFTFDNYNDIFKIIEGGKKINTDLISEYIEKNTWDHFGENLIKNIE